MLRYILKRMVQMVPLILIISFIGYGIIRVAEIYANVEPATIAALRMAENVSEQTIERERERLGLNQPFVIRYTMWLGRFVRGDLGQSNAYKTSVSSLILSRLNNTLVLGVATLVVTWIIAIPLGIYLAVRQYSFVDQAFSSISYFFMGFPDFFLAILFLLFASMTGLFPIGGMTSADNNHMQKISEIMAGTYTPTAQITMADSQRKADDEVRGLALQQQALDNVRSDLRREFVTSPRDFISPITTQRVLGYVDAEPNLALTAEFKKKLKAESEKHQTLTVATAQELYQQSKALQPFTMGMKISYFFSHLQYYFHHWSRYIPDLVHHLFLPTLTLALISIASLQRRMRANLLDVLGDEYIKTARAKGLSETKVIYKHAVRNALNPIVTLLGFEIAGLISGAAFVEIIFSWPGLGNIMLQAVVGNDLDLVMGGLMISTIMLLIGNLLADLILAAVDPRIKLEA